VRDHVVIAVDGRFVVLRDSRPDDRDLLLALYASTRAAELEMVPWPDDVKAAFIAQQFSAQDIDYRQRHPDGSFLVVELVDDTPSTATPIGRLYTAWVTPADLRILDVVLAAEWRGRGVGSALVAHVCAQADAAGAITSLHVEPGNPAVSLYRRFGFVDVARTDFHVLMERPVS
jgi:ribosomal protein S18 acetylase RimI-like enzyme